MTLVVRAFPPVAVLLINTASALQPRADLVALRTRLYCLGVVARAAFTVCIRGEPPCNNGPLRVGRRGKLEDEAKRGKRKRDGEDHPPRPPPSPAGDNNFGCASPHAARPRTARTIQINIHAPMNPAIR
jgi:hypothetical protein